ncbi:hypothetical protein T439DRAFT_355972 [Meredithblackwellia eburnea MCA 4105]
MLSLPNASELEVDLPGSLPLESASTSSPPAVNEAPDNKAKTRASLACSRCRRRKQRCDQKAPVCTNCSSLGKAARCEYTKGPGKRRRTKAEEARAQEEKKRKLSEQSPPLLPLPPVPAVPSAWDGSLDPSGLDLDLDLTFPTTAPPAMPELVSPSFTPASIHTPWQHFKPARKLPPLSQAPLQGEPSSRPLVDDASLATQGRHAPAPGLDAADTSCSTCPTCRQNVGRNRNRSKSSQRRSSVISSVVSVDGYSDDERDYEDEVGKGTLEDNAVRGLGFLSVNAVGNPVYVGPSSGFSWARLILEGMQTRQRKANSGSFKQSKIRATTQKIGDSTPLQYNSLSNVPQESADTILRHCYRHIQPRYAFLDWYYVHELWAHRDEIMDNASKPNPSQESATGAFFIWILFAIGSRLCSGMSLAGISSPEAYHEKAMEHFEVIVGLHDLKNAQALLLMIMYAFRAPDAPSVWFLVGINLKLCISLGLHREITGARAQGFSPYILQLRRRIFWASYTLDRMAMSLGRPLGIDDRDIDISMPYDRDCVDISPQPASPSGGKLTSMTSAILCIELIESLVQVQRYRLHHEHPEESPEPLLDMIHSWESRIPPEADLPTAWDIPCCMGPNAQLRYLTLLAQYSADACLIHARLHKSQHFVVSLESLRSIFLCGLTLLHSVRMNRHSLSTALFQRAIRACSNSLFLNSQHFSSGEAFHEAFEDLASAVAEFAEKSPKADELMWDPNAGSSTFDLWHTVSNDMPSVMNIDTQDDYVQLLQSLGVPVGSWGTQEATTSSLGVSDPTYSETSFDFSHLLSFTN